MNRMDHEGLGRVSTVSYLRRKSLLARPGVVIPFVLAIAIAVVVGIIYYLNFSGRAHPGTIARPSQANGSVSEVLARLPAPDLLRPLSPADAQAANQLRPVVARSDTPSGRFTISGDPISKLRARDCLTQAIYYEAASEGIEGGRAVAQIVLNRMRHAAYPNSICGVVYQGSDRVTGCQFSFTCDGSLARVPQAYLWARSRQIASDAIGGTVFAPVGHATHYHADYVLPYWADSLDKIAVIGRHIFYRFKGAAGGVRAFNQRYASAEPSPPLLPPSNVVEESLQSFEGGAIANPAPKLPELEEDRIETLKLGPKPQTEKNLPLQADLARGMLIVGEASPNLGKAKSQPSDECEKDGALRIKPVGANDLQSQSDKSTC